MSTPDQNTAATAPAQMPVRHDPERVPLYRFLAPRFWGVWLGIGIVRLVNVLPLPVQMLIGRATGRLAYLFSRRDRRVAAINIDLSLPELDRTQRRQWMPGHATRAHRNCAPPPRAASARRREAAVDCTLSRNFGTERVLVVGHRAINHGAA